MKEGKLFSQAHVLLLDVKSNVGKHVLLYLRVNQSRWLNKLHLIFPDVVMFMRIRF